MTVGVCLLLHLTNINIKTKPVSFSIENELKTEANVAKGF